MPTKSVLLFSLAAMASLFLSSFLFLNRNPTLPKSLGFSSKTWLTRLRFRVLACRASPVIFPNLQADDFRHPVDKQNTRLLRAIPGLSEIGEFVKGHIEWDNDSLVLVTPRQFPKLHKLMAEAAEILNVEAPLLFVRQDPEVNAALAAVNNRPYIVVNSGLMELLTLEELQAVFAHELGHLKCDHCLWLTFADLCCHGVKALPGVGWLISQSVEEELVRWRQSAELSCDRASLLVAGDPMVVISCMMKFAGGCKSMMEELDVQEFLKQARAYDEASSSSSTGLQIRVNETQPDHPGLVRRAADR